MKWFRRLLLLFFLTPLFICLGLMMMVASNNGSNTQNDRIDQTSSLSLQVENYRETVMEMAEEYDMSDYVDLILAVMQVESGGNGNDPMQASEGPFNKKYPKVPNGITDPLYSIECGIQELHQCLELAGVKGPGDMEAIKVALGGYNFGTGFISWAEENNGGKWSLEAAAEFSKIMAEKMGWTAYGDPSYANKVMNYYSLYSIVIGDGDFVLPIHNAKIMYEYGSHGSNDFHYGLDISGGYGSTVYAPIDAKVNRVETGCDPSGGYLGNSCPATSVAIGTGNYIQLEIEYEGRTLYMTLCHMSDVFVSEGQEVLQGQAIGAEGNSGNSTGTHLHIEVHQGNSYALGSMDRIIDPGELFGLRNEVKG